jgi:hypothetical protein
MASTPPRPTIDNIKNWSPDENRRRRGKMLSAEASGLRRHQHYTLVSSYCSDRLLRQKAVVFLLLCSDGRPRHSSTLLLEWEEAEALQHHRVSLLLEREEAEALHCHRVSLLLERDEADADAVPVFRATRCAAT